MAEDLHVDLYGDLFCLISKYLKKISTQWLLIILGLLSSPACFCFFSNPLASVRHKERREQACSDPPTFSGYPGKFEGGLREANTRAVSAFSASEKGAPFRGGPRGPEGMTPNDNKAQALTGV